MKRSRSGSISISGSLLWSGVVALGVSLSGCGAESAATQQCQRYLDAYCDYVGRCAATDQALVKQQCHEVFSATLDCSSAREDTGDFQGCMDAIASAECPAISPTACQATVRRFKPECTRDPSAATGDQASALDACQSGAVSTTNYPPGKDVDLLFVIDNSPSMSPKQAALAQSFPGFLKQIELTGANYHIGIATSDVGTNVAPEIRWGGNIGACDTYAGDDGLLQSAACTTRVTTTTAAKTACAAACPDSRFVPTNGQRYISRQRGVTNVPVAMELDVTTGRMIDTGPQKAFKCMAMVGDAGCGVEGTLEGAKRALDGHRDENSGFLRANSLLTVLFITDEDDCSVQMSKRAENNPMTRDCDPSQSDSYECYNVDYRCLARSLQCNESMLTQGTKSGCTERPNNYLENVDKYVRFFQTLRPASKLLVSGIWTLPAIPGGGKVEIARGSGGTTTPFLNRATGAGASCVSSRDQTFFGQAQFRLSKFAASFGRDAQGRANALEVSVCDIDSYGSALSQVADRLVPRLQSTCLAQRPRLTAGGRPDCLVGDVDVTTPLAAPASAFPVCSTTCCDAWAAAPLPVSQDPGIQAACAGETTDACFCALSSRVPDTCTYGAVAGVWRRGGGAAPAGTSTSFRCVND